MPTRKNPPLQKQKLETQPTSSGDSSKPPSFSLKKAAVRFQIGREEILSKYWALANLEPEATKGTIAGQLKALDSLCEELGMTTPSRSRAEEKANGPRDIYRSAWLGRDSTDG